MEVILLISGGLGTEILMDSIKKRYDLSCVFTNRSSKAIIECCKKNNILYYVGNPRLEKAESFIKKVDCDLLLSINYLYIINKNLIDKARKIAVNIHGSLLPKYRGRTPHIWAIINNEKEAGVTAHEIIEGLDSGNILFQEKVEIGFDDTGADVLRKYVPIYKTFVNRIIESTLNDSFKIIVQDENQATYYGKRTPEDGRIDFNWSKERIRNWVRAQAKPYPGAFFYYQKEKVTVHEAFFNNLGFRQEDKNGKILLVGNKSIIIKTPNGALELNNIQNFTKFNFKLNTVLL